MSDREKRKTSTGFYSTNFRRPTFSNPNPIKRIKRTLPRPYEDGWEEVGWYWTHDGEFYLPVERDPNASFIIPGDSDTVALETEWFSGGLIKPDRRDFGLSKHDWNTKVVKALEPHLPSKIFNGKLVFNFHGGFLQRVTVKTIR